MNQHIGYEKQTEYPLQRTRKLCASEQFFRQIGSASLYFAQAQVPLF
jgi:hypothetical protein